MDKVGLYIDVENLQGIAKQTIISAYNQWPKEFPRPTMVKLYVRADQVQLWHIWATDRFPALNVLVEGVQHYALHGSKNAADIMLALDALADLLREKVTHVAILSDDSDFASLFAKIKQETQQVAKHKIPFIWFVTDRPDTRSSTLSDFLPLGYLQMVSCADMKTIIPDQEQGHPIDENQLTEEDRMARAIIRHIAVGFFKSTDCRRTIAHYFPQHPLADADNPTFGTLFAKTLWPILENYGVIHISPGKKPRRYEMTKAAKNKIEGNDGESQHS